MQARLNTTKPSQAAIAAYAAAAFFVLAFARFFILPPEGYGNLLVTLIGVAPHLLLFPVIAALPAPPWARAAGFGWLVLDMTTGIMALNGVAAAIFIAMRYGGHVSAGVWIAAASWQAKGATRIVGLLTALDLAGYSFAAPFVPMYVLYPAELLLALWLLLIGLRLSARPEG
ncbi:MAG: hypothetical protein ACR2M0_11130 [Chloroflexia bacterium]